MTETPARDAHQATGVYYRPSPHQCVCNARQVHLEPKKKEQHHNKRQNQNKRQTKTKRVAKQIQNTNPKQKRQQMRVHTINLTPARLTTSPHVTQNTKKKRTLWKTSRRTNQNKRHKVCLSPDHLILLDPIPSLPLPTLQHCTLSLSAPWSTNANAFPIETPHPRPGPPPGVTPTSFPLAPLLR